MPVGSLLEDGPEPEQFILNEERHYLGELHRFFFAVGEASPGQGQIQVELFYDYRTNVEAYPKWQAWMRKAQPDLLVIWGKHDLSFDSGEPERYRKDVPKAEVHVLDAGHFAVDTKPDEIAELVRQFLAAHLEGNAPALSR